MSEVTVIAFMGSIVRLTVPYHPKRPEIEKAIEETLRSGAVAWEPDDHGVNVVCEYKNNLWRPRRRFLVREDYDLE